VKQMEAEARYTWVGAAVLALLLSLVAAIVWLTDFGSKSDLQRFAIYFEEQALDGLEVGGEVRVRGINIGRVEDYALSTTTLNRVRVEIRLDKRADVRENTVAVISRNLVTGIAAINLITREPAGAALTRIEEGNQLPVIGEGRSGMDEMTGRVNRVGDLATVALNNFSALVSKDNTVQLMATINRLGDLAQGLEQRLGVLESTLKNTGEAATSIAGSASRLSAVSERVASVAETTGASVTALADSANQQVDNLALQASQTLDVARTALDKTNDTLNGARATLDQVKASVERLEQQAGATTRRLELSAEQVEDQLNATTSELRASLEAATRVLDRLRDPRAAVLGPTPGQRGPGEAKP